MALNTALFTSRKFSLHFTFASTSDRVRVVLPPPINFIIWPFIISISSLTFVNAFGVKKCVFIPSIIIYIIKIIQVIEAISD